MNYLPINIFMATLSLLSGFLYSVIPIKRLARGELAFHYVILSCLWASLCFIFILRLFFNKSSTRFTKTTKSAKKIYTKYLSTLIEIINTALFIFVLSLVFWIYKRGYDSSFCYVIIIVYGLFHLLVSVITPKLIIPISKEDPLYFSIAVSRRFDETGVKVIYYLILLLPSFVGSFVFMSLTNMLPHLSSLGLIIAVIAGLILVVISCVLNRLLLEREYKRR